MATDKIERIRLNSPFLQFRVIFYWQVTTWRKAGCEVQAPLRGPIIVAPPLWRLHPALSLFVASHLSFCDRCSPLVRQFCDQHGGVPEDCSRKNYRAGLVVRAILLPVQLCAFCGPSGLAASRHSLLVSSACATREWQASVLLRRQRYDCRGGRAPVHRKPSRVRGL